MRRRTVMLSVCDHNVAHNSYSTINRTSVCFRFPFKLACPYGVHEIRRRPGAGRGLPMDSTCEKHACQTQIAAFPFGQANI